jgi:hypothetical protein
MVAMFQLLPAAPGMLLRMNFPLRLSVLLRLGSLLRFRLSAAPG